MRPCNRRPLLLIPYREVRHDQPDDCLHYESVAIRGAEMDWTIPAHRHDGLHQFQWLQQGAVKGSIDGRGFEASGPAMLMLAPGSVHAFDLSPRFGRPPGHGADLDPAPDCSAVRISSIPSWEPRS